MQPGKPALEPTAVAVRPSPLTPEATAGIVARRLGEPASPLFTAVCHRTTSGNPLLLHQLLRALEADGVHPDTAHADMLVVDAVSRHRLKDQTAWLAPVASMGSGVADLFEAVGGNGAVRPVRAP